MPFREAVCFAGKTNRLFLVTWPSCCKKAVRRLLLHSQDEIDRVMLSLTGDQEESGEIDPAHLLTCSKVLLRPSGGNPRPTPKSKQRSAASIGEAAFHAPCN